MSKQSDRLTWAKDFVKLSPTARKELVETVLQLLKESKHEGDRKLYEAITKGGYELVGVQPMLVYNRVSIIEDVEDLQVDWYHKWGFPTLIYGHTKSCHLLIVNPWIRISGSVINEIPGNARVNIVKGQVTG